MKNKSKKNSYAQLLCIASLQRFLFIKRFLFIIAIAELRWIAAAHCCSAYRF
jgi:hypothetical protein